jgi:hypothetical protein
MVDPSEMDVVEVVVMVWWWSGVEAAQRKVKGWFWRPIDGGHRQAP